ncbi:MAG: hypothetical protein ACK5Z2_08065, partial [Bacteroidota bacterium]
AIMQFVFRIRTPFSGFQLFVCGVFRKNYNISLSEPFINIHFFLLILEKIIFLMTVIIKKASGASAVTA